MTGPADGTPVVYWPGREGFFQCGQSRPLERRFVRKKQLTGETVGEAVRLAVEYRDRNEPSEVLFIRVPVQRDDGMFVNWTGRVKPGEKSVAWFNVG